MDFVFDSLEIHVVSWEFHEKFLAKIVRKQEYFSNIQDFRLRKAHHMTGTATDVFLGLLFMYYDFWEALKNGDVNLHLWTVRLFLKNSQSI